MSAQDSRQAGALSQYEAIEVTPAMIEAGVREFVSWFELPEHQEAMRELPERASIEALISSSFLSMASVSPLSR